MRRLDAPPAAPGETLLVVFLLLALSAWMIRAHREAIDEPNMGVKLELHGDVLANRAPDPYQYKLWPITQALEGVRRLTGIPLTLVYYGNTILSLLLLVFLHHAWLRTIAPPSLALVGGLALGALCLILFLNYWHHPYEFWGVALYCVLLRGIARDASLLGLVAIALLTGLVWEKHAVLPFLWGFYALQRGRPFVRTLLQGLLFLAASLAVPIALRLALGADRAHVDGATTWDVQPWGRVLWVQMPYVLPFLAILLFRWRVVPAWVRWTWLAVPLSIAAYASQGFLLHEVRSFWLLAPVFTATLVAWLRADGVRHSSFHREGAAPRTSPRAPGP